MSWANASPVWPSYSCILPLLAKPAASSSLCISSAVAPANGGAPGELVADADISHLRDGDHYLLDDAGLELVALLAREDAHTNNTTLLAALHPEAGVLHVLGLVAEDAPQEALLRRELGLALGRHLTDENVAGTHFRADADDALFVEVLEPHLADVRDVVSGGLGTELRVAHHTVEVLDVDGGELGLLDEAFGNDDGVFVVGAVPTHEGDAHVLI